MSRRVLVSGVGLITAIGEGRETFWNNLLQGRSGVAPITAFDTSRYPVHNGAEVRTFDAAAYLARWSSRPKGRASQFAIASAYLALEDAQIKLHLIDREAVCVVVGTTSGEAQFIEALDDALVAGNAGLASGQFVRHYPCDTIAAHVGAEFGFAGTTLAIPTACAAGNSALAVAYDLIRSGQADLALAGGSDALSRITYAGFARLGAIAPLRCQPFDRGRRGMIPGEGSAMLLLEADDHLRRRRGSAYAEMAGYGFSCDAHHMTSGHPAADGVVRAMNTALASTGIDPSCVSYISAHGTGTAVNDRLETMAIKRVFGRSAYSIPVSSIKPMLGHAMGAASAIEAAACALAIANDKIPATIHWEERDPECDLDYVPNHARDHRVNIALNNAYTFGGNNSSVVFRKIQGAA